MFEWLDPEFMRLALVAVLLMAPLFAVLGTLVVNNSMAYFSDTVGHSALTGIALGVGLGLDSPFWAMILFSGLLSLIWAVLRKYSRNSSDTSIGLIMAFSVAFGVVLLSRGGNFSKYSHFLVGNILTVETKDLWLVGVLDLAVFAIWPFLSKRLYLISIHRSLAASRKISIFFWESLFAFVLAIVVTVSIQWVGLLVVNSLLVMPAAASRNLAKGLKSYLLLSVGISWMSALGGLLMSWYLNTAAGASIVLFLLLFFVLSVGISHFKSRRVVE